MKNPKSFAKSQSKEIFSIIDIIKRRDFRGNTGIAVKNSVYQFSTNIFAKIGSFIFTIIIARMLMPEMFGLYSLALSTILIFGAFSELGVGTTLVRFISKELGKKKPKIKPYFLYLIRIKVFLILLVAFALALSANYVANIFYQKPIFLALLAGILYIVINNLNGFLKGMIQASNNFFSIFKREIIFQFSRIFLVPLAILFAVRYSLSDKTSLMLIILAISLSLFFASLLLFFDVKKNYKNQLRNEKIAKLSKKEKKVVDKFLLATAVLVLSGVFFGDIDKVMLGKFVESSFIGYYTAAFSFIGALIALVGGASAVLLPIFSRLRGRRLEKGFKKSIRITFLFSLIIFLVTIPLSKLAVLIVYGSDYVLAANILRLLALSLLILPVIALYETYQISKGKPNIVTTALILSTVLNIILNYILITSFLKFSQLHAVYGAALATTLSKFFLLGCLIFIGKKRIK